MIDPSILPTLQKGDAISADHYAGVTEAARQKFAYPHHGSSDSVGSVYRNRLPNSRITVIPSVDMPRWSIFQLYFQVGVLPITSLYGNGMGETQWLASPVDINPTPNGNHYSGYAAYGYGVNQDGDLTAGAPGRAILAIPGVPIMCYNATTGAQPQAGNLCGIAATTLNVTNSSFRDLICYSSSGARFREVIWVPWIEVEATANNGGDITPPTNGYTSPTTFTATMTGPDSSDTHNPIHFVAGSGIAAGNITVVNRDVHLFIKDGDYIRCRFINNEWRVVWRTDYLDVQGNNTGGGTPLLGANSPATVNTAPYTWVKVKAFDGTTVFMPAWK